MRGREGGRGGRSVRDLKENTLCIREVEGGRAGVGERIRGEM